MQRIHVRAAICLALVWCAGSALADDLGWVTVDNRFQAEVLTGIIGQAYYRDGNQFLVSPNPTERAQLERAGLNYAALPELTSEEALIAQPRRPLEPREASGSFAGKVTELGGQAYLVRPSQSVTQAASNDPLYTFRAVTEHSIRITYLPKTVATFSQDLFPNSDTLANLISADSMQSYVERLEAFRTRYIWTDSIDAARDWIVQKLQEWGYTDVTTPSFYWGGGWHYNVKAVKPGIAEPDHVIVVGGHYDSIVFGSGTDPFTYAPGADDNASGTVIAMELARVLAAANLRKTVIFMPFSAEEVGLVGSSAAAADFAAQGTKLEVMYNYDMVAHDPSNSNQIDMSAAASNTAYRDHAAFTALRVSDLLPQLVAAGASSDHASFMQQGFTVCNNIETDFNFAGWHTNLDISTRLDFDYLANVGRMAVASVSYVADAAHPTEIEEIVDMGDGQTLWVKFADCDPAYLYTTYWGTSPQSYVDSFYQIDPTCGHFIGGLTEGTTYYFTVVGDAPGGYPAVYGVEASGVPLLIPRTPMAARTDPGDHKIDLDWADNREADFSHYRIYRAEGMGAFVLYQDNVDLSAFTDDFVTPQTEYHYQISAVDTDGFESDPSPTISGYAATFDGGILVVDEIKDDAAMPSETGQASWIDSLFGDLNYRIIRNDTSGAALDRNQAGRYSSIFWLDDDLSAKLIGASEDSLKWYADNPGNLLVEGWRTMYFWGLEADPGTMYYDDFGISSFVLNSAQDFAGATGLNGWPDVVVDMSNPFGNLPYVPAMTLRAGAVPIYSFDSFSDNPAYEGEPCAVLYNDGEEKHILLGFPLYFLTEQSAINLVQYAAQLFGESVLVVVPGDMNGDMDVSPTDLSYLVDHLYAGGVAPAHPNAADVNGDCRFDPIDLAYFVDFFFNGGSPPQMGCVQ